MGPMTAMLGCGLVLSLVLVAQSYPCGAPVNKKKTDGTPMYPDLCQTLFPEGHGVAAQSSQPLTEITASSSCYKEGLKIEVKVKTKQGELNNDEAKIEGVFIQARSNTGNVANNQAEGQFSVKADEEALHTVKCFNKDNSALSHKKEVKVNEHTFVWHAPSGLTDPIVFYGTIARRELTFWTGVTSPVVTYSASCAQGTVINTPNPTQQGCIGNVAKEDEPCSTKTCEDNGSGRGCHAPCLISSFFLSFLLAVYVLTNLRF